MKMLRQIFIATEIRRIEIGITISMYQLEIAFYGVKKMFIPISILD